tara:strand:+ start:6816 stop:7094 length:279 start_codon:yes stop_codon:yes gene_type:complete
MKILEKAIKTFEERGTQYGDFATRFQRTAQSLSNLIKAPVSGSDICKIMIVEKLSRSHDNYIEDNWIDIINYAAMADSLQKEEKHTKIRPIK